MNATSVATNMTDPVAAAKAKAIAEAKRKFLLYLTDRFHTLQLFLLTGYGIMFMLCVILICYMRYNRSNAFKGDSSAARKIILPAFEPLLWILGGSTGTYTIYFCCALIFKVYTSEISKLATEFFYSGRQFVFASVIVFMLQKSVSIPALRRTVFITFILSTYTIPIVWYMTNYGAEEDFYWVMTISRSLMLLLYTYVFIRPPVRASKRTIREYCVFTYIYYALLFAYNEMFHRNKAEAGFNLTYTNLMVAALCPLFIWRVLKADTEHWRGMGQRACALQCLFRQKNNIHERISSQGLHVLIEMHRKYIIDFAYLELKQRIGVGASATVFNGILHSKIPVAIKVYTPSEFTEETVAEFSHEAALCGALHHPNIVQFYGMCVCPPTICLVSELCQGSLEDVSCAISRRDRHSNRQQILINLGYMLDAARAVAYIHSFSPAFIHRDIKPGNFLVDAEFNVKLTDFGESRSLPRSQRPQDEVLSGGFINNGQRVPTATRMTVRGTVDYMAPEIINGKAGLATYGEAADVYSLAITMWDILHPGREKFPTLRNNHLQVFDHVVEGNRPEFNEDLHPSLREVIESAWSPHAHLRPSAQNIVSILESIQEEMFAAFALQLSSSLDQRVAANNKYGNTIENSFTGAHAIEKMEELYYIHSPGEGIRLGNALMDAGLVHHLKHSRSFEYGSQLYYFDEENIHLCQPLDLSEQSNVYMDANSVGTVSSSHASTAASATVSVFSRFSKRSRRRGAGSTGTSDWGARSGSTRSDQLFLENGMCTCRKLGQRIYHPKVMRRRFRRKFKAIAEENVLTTNLLQEESNNDFEDFDAVTINVAA